MARIVFFLIGLLLSVTAGLKLWMLLTDPFADLTLGIPVSWLWFAIVVEFSCIGLLVSVVDPALKLLVCFLLFGVLLCVGLVRIGFGETTCGCMGPFELPAGVSIATNAGILLALYLLVVFGNRRFSSLLIRSRIAMKRLRQSVFGSPYILGGIVATITFLGFQITGVSSVIGNQHRSKLFATPVMMPAGKLGEFVHGTTQITNRSARAVSLIGNQSSCSCTSFLPEDRTIPPESSVSVPVLMRLVKLGRTKQRIRVFTDCPHEFVVSLDVFGNCQ